MFTIILASLIGAIIGLITGLVKTDGYSDEYKSKETRKLTLVGVSYGAMAGCFLWCFCGMLFDVGAIGNRTSEEVVLERRALVSLKDGQGGVNGRFFLGTGMFQSDMMYYGYEDLGDDRYKMVKFSTSGNIIVQDVKEGENPYFNEIKKIYGGDQNKEWDYWIFGPLDEERTERFEIHIPKGSILKEEYKLDSE